MHGRVRSRTMYPLVFFYTTVSMVSINRRCSQHPPETSACVAEGPVLVENWRGKSRHWEGDRRSKRSCAC